MEINSTSKILRNLGLAAVTNEKGEKPANAKEELCLIPTAKPKEMNDVL
ncbi:hypothetical protein [Legionella sp.]